LGEMAEEYSARERDMCNLRYSLLETDYSCRSIKLIVRSVIMKIIDFKGALSVKSSGIMLSKTSI
jgi:hypothetical protein